MVEEREPRCSQGPPKHAACPHASPYPSAESSNSPSLPAHLPDPGPAGDGMPQRDWLALVAVHSDSWLLAVSFFYAVKLDAQGRWVGRGWVDGGGCCCC